MAETQQVKAGVRFKSICTQFIVPDVVKAAEYYRDVLGFRILGYFLDPPVFAMVARDGVEMHFGKADEGQAPSPNLQRRHEIGIDAYIWVNDVDALYAELKARGAKIIDTPVKRVYNCYEMTVEDNFGFRLVFSGDFQNP